MGKDIYLQIIDNAGHTLHMIANGASTKLALPYTYNKHLQESWEPMPDHVKTISDSIQIANGILSTGADASCTRPNPSRHRPCRLPRQKGVPFRETHHISGQVAKSEELGIPMDKLSLEQLKAIDGRFTDEVMHTFNY
ncbi:uncharacterized protein TrAtP1_010960 [Trichoderma atroviride]|uniref:uncharacterized protein n=1 Tax=Hypocrea atroviridis TaxID=63577 RepID=UPI00331DF8A3|nr:hypothetical protein TrAtP1_010960 [Trichoderma atroviride]